MFEEDLTNIIGDPYAVQGREILKLIRTRASEEAVQEQINTIQTAAAEAGVQDPTIPSVDVYMTCVAFAGSKSLSHILSYIERCKERLLSNSTTGTAGQRQIINSVITYWTEKPGIAVNIVDKLLNYTILSPLAVIEWTLIDQLESGAILTKSYIYEMIASTIHKVTNRVRQIVAARNQPGLPLESLKILDETLDQERSSMVQLFTVIEDALQRIADGRADQDMEQKGEEEKEEAILLQAWGNRWLKVFRRKMAVEHAWTQDMLTNPPPPPPVLLPVTPSLQQQQQQQQQQPAAEQDTVTTVNGGDAVGNGDGNGKGTTNVEEEMTDIAGAE